MFQMAGNCYNFKVKKANLSQTNQKTIPVVKEPCNRSNSFNLKETKKSKILIADPLRYPLDKVSEVFFVQEVLNKLLDSTNGCFQEEQVQQLMLHISDISKSDQSMHAKFGCSNHFKTPCVFHTDKHEAFSNLGVLNDENFDLESKSFLKQFIRANDFKKCFCCQDLKDSKGSSTAKSDQKGFNIFKDYLPLYETNETLKTKGPNRVNSDPIIVREDFKSSPVFVCDAVPDLEDESVSLQSSSKQTKPEETAITEIKWPVPEITIAPPEIELIDVQNSFSQMNNFLDSNKIIVSSNEKKISKTNIYHKICGFNEVDVERKLTLESPKESDKQSKCYVKVGVNNDGIMSIDFCPSDSSVLNCRADSVDTIDQDASNVAALVYPGNGDCNRLEDCSESFPYNDISKVQLVDGNLIFDNRESEEGDIAKITLPSSTFKKWTITKSNFTNTDIRCVNEAIQTVCSSDLSCRTPRNFKLAYFTPLDIRKSYVACAIVYIFSMLCSVPLTIISRLTFRRVG